MGAAPICDDVGRARSSSHAAGARASTNGGGGRDSAGARCTAVMKGRDLGHRKGDEDFEERNLTAFSEEC